MEREGLDVLSAFPRQVLESMLERAVLPFLMHLPVTLILPLVTVTRLQSPRFAAANGQWLSFRREAYFALGGHARRPSEVLEDVEFAIHAKKMGKRLGIAYGTQSLSVRMYRKNSDLIEGLTKNLALLLGRTTSKVFSRSTFLFFVFITPLLYPWFAPGNPLAWLPLLLLTALRIGSALLMRSGWREILLHPFGAIGILFLILRSFVHVRRGTAQWKGRVLS
jgi:chlorobactene glucosyltransferase